MTPDSSPPPLSPSTGFLSGFVETGLEKPADDVSGDCIVHFSRYIDTFDMKVKLVNGKREGEAIMLKNDASFIRLVYSNGVLNGPVERMSNQRFVEVHDYLKNGMEQRVFRGYDSDSVIWMGYYRSGNRYSDLIKSKSMRGWYEERNGMDYFLISIAQ